MVVPGPRIFSKRSRRTLPGSSVTSRPKPSGVVRPVPDRGFQTIVTTPRSSSQTASGGPNRSSAGMASANPAVRRASSRLTERPRSRPAPGWPRLSEGPGGDEATGVAEVTAAAEGVGDGPGPKTIRMPGRPNPTAPAIAASTSNATMPRTSARRTGRAAGPRRPRRSRMPGRPATAVAVAWAGRRARRAGSESGAATGGTAGSGPMLRRTAPSSSSPSPARRRTSAIVRASVGDRQLGPETADRPRQPRLHRAARQVEDLGGLGLAEIEEVAGGDDLAVVRAQLVECADERLAGLAVEDRRLGRWGRITRPAILEGPQGQAGATARRAASVARLVGDDPQQPGPERGAAAEPVERAVGLDERLLDRILGVAVGRDDVGRPDRHVLVAP